MKKTELNVQFHELIEFLKSIQFEKEPRDTRNSASVFDDVDEGYSVDEGSGPMLETSPSSSLIRSWEIWGNQDES